MSDPMLAWALAAVGRRRFALSNAVSQCEPECSTCADMAEDAVAAALEAWRAAQEPAYYVVRDFLGRYVCSDSWPHELSEARADAVRFSTLKDAEDAADNVEDGEVVEVRDAAE